MSRRKYSSASWGSNLILGTLIIFLTAFAFGANRLGDRVIAFWAFSAATACCVALAIINSNRYQEED
jgi:hypothetical protein